MTKAEYFAKHKAGKRMPVDPIEGLPPLFAKKMTAGEFSDCLDPKKLNGKDDFVLNYAKAALISVVTDDGTPFFEEKDVPDLENMDLDGMGPLSKAINAANGLNAEKKADSAVAGTP